MPPAVVYLETDLEAFQQYYQRDELPEENWEEELVDPGRLVYVGQGQAQYLRITEVDPGIVWPKRRRNKKKKKKGTSPPPVSPEPAPAPPAPIDWGDWEELCQAAPPPSPPPVWDFPYEELAVPQSPPEPEDLPWEPEDWDAELASQSEEDPEDWEAEIAVFQTALYLREDWEAELASQWQPEDWESELSQ
jgi:hypothetical protein